MRISRRNLIAVAAVIGLQGCGFHLRGRFSLPFSRLYLDMPRNTPMTGSLRRQLKTGSNVVLVEDREQSEAVLRLVRTNRSRTVLALNTEGRAREFELKLTITFSLTDPKGLEYLPPTTITAIREITYDETEYLSRGKQEAVLFNEMELDIINQLIHRIERVRPLAPGSGADAEPDERPRAPEPAIFTFEPEAGEPAPAGQVQPAPSSP